MDYKSKRHHFDIMKNQLESERASFISHWRDISDHILPRRARFNLSDANRGEKKNQKIIDSTATLAARTLRSGMMAGITSPARPWFRLTTPDPDLAEFGSVKRWLDQVQQIMTTSYLKSNLYNILPIMYGDLGVFGTAPISIEEDFTGEVIHSKSFPIGSYSIAKSPNGRINTFMREFRMTVAQLVEQFGKRDTKSGKYLWDNFSTHVRNLYDQGQYQAWIDVTHIIMPNKDYNPNNPFSKFKKFLSYYYESGTNSGLDSVYDDRMLEAGGYDYFPVLCPRWETTGEDVYGTSCPGMDALGDIKQLQHGERRVMEAVDKMVRPPMTGPTSLKNSTASILPGDITYVDTVSGQQGFRPSHEINFRIQEMEMKQDQIRNRIQRAFYEDLFLMLANSDRRQITAREIEERHEEKLLALGPVLEQLNQDLLDPMTDIVFDIHMRQGLLPPPPDEIQGMDLKVEYISVMAQAQKLLGISSIERFTGFVSQVAAADPGILDKINSDQIIDVYADTISLPPSIVRTDDEVAEIRGQRAQAQKQAQQMQMTQAAAATAKDLGQTPIGEDSALGAMLGLANAGIN
jgi:hypothetical protein